ncbi:hypothetical protein [Pseudomonas agarici]|nr:hypothetical protein [Pseudomonas agarici]NWB92676.1 hypothetical protein [Pseudomonas agarici]NWC10636.1 hypothetical protein [Pseudomonas agarici]
MSARRVLAPGDPQHFKATVTVPVAQMNALLLSNQAIDDTWRILNYGSGNQRRHVRATQAESFKRTVVSYDADKSQGYPGFARSAARFGAGNCDQMAMVNALLLASAKDQHQQVSVVLAADVGHVFVEVGDSRESNNTVISDAWPEFGRALRRQDFSLLGAHPEVLYRYQPRYNPDEREQLLRGPKASQQEIDREFARLRPNEPSDKAQLTDFLLANTKLYTQVHASKNLGLRYEGDSSRGDERRIDQNFSERQFRKRLDQLGINPWDGTEVPHNPPPAPIVATLDFPSLNERSRGRNASSRVPAAPLGRSETVDTRSSPVVTPYVAPRDDRRWVPPTDARHYRPPVDNGNASRGRVPPPRARAESLSTRERPVIPHYAPAPVERRHAPSVSVRRERVPTHDGARYRDTPPARRERSSSLMARVRNFITR